LTGLLVMYYLLSLMVVFQLSRDVPPWLIRL
jgi:hypothetical protein